MKMQDLRPGQMLTLYLTVCAYDGGRREELGVFSTENAAKIQASGKGEWGGDASVEEIRAIVGENDKVYMLKSTKPLDIDEEAEKSLREVRAKAAEQLTETQRRALGIDEKGNPVTQEIPNWKP